MTAKAIVAYSVLTAAVGLLVTKYVLAVRSTVQGEEAAACAALEAEPLEAEAPAFELPDLRGKKQSLAAQRGKVVLLHFWATWCPPCVDEIPSLARLQQAMSARDFSLITVSVDEDEAKLREFIGQHKAAATLTVLRDPAKTVSASYGTTKFPESYIVDRTGTVRHKLIYKRDWGSSKALACLRSVL
jgi:peroxiredoxin